MVFRSSPPMMEAPENNEWPSFANRVGSKTKSPM
jgi:hypothetical protein